MSIHFASARVHKPDTRVLRVYLVHCVGKLCLILRNSAAAQYQSLHRAEAPATTMSLVMNGPDFPTVARAYRPESSRSDDDKAARMAEFAKLQVRGDYRVAASKVPFDGALPPLSRPVQQLRRSTGSSSPQSPRIESYHPVPRLLKPVRLNPFASAFFTLPLKARHVL